MKQRLPFFLIITSSIYPDESEYFIDDPFWIDSLKIKECIKDVFESSKKIMKFEDKEIHVKDNELISSVFSEKGGLGFKDAKMLFFPIQSKKGMFTWITCPGALDGFKKDMKEAGVQIPEHFERIEKRVIASKDIMVSDDYVVLEDIRFQVKADENIREVAKWFANKIFPKMDEDDGYWYLREKFQNDLIVLDDEEFRSIVKGLSRLIKKEEKRYAILKDTIFYSSAIFEDEFTSKYFQEGIEKMIVLGKYHIGLTRIELIKP